MLVRVQVKGFGRANDLLFAGRIPMSKVIHHFNHIRAVSRPFKLVLVLFSLTFSPEWFCVLDSVLLREARYRYEDKSERRDRG